VKLNRWKKKKKPYPSRSQLRKKKNEKTHQFPSQAHQRGGLGAQRGRRKYRRGGVIKGLHGDTSKHIVPPPIGQEGGQTELKSTVVVCQRVTTKKVLKTGGGGKQLKRRQQPPGTKNYFNYINPSTQGGDTHRDQKESRLQGKLGRSAFQKAFKLRSGTQGGGGKRAQGGEGGFHMIRNSRSRF